MAEQAFVHQLPLTRFLLPAQGCSLGRDVRGHDCQHAVLHVLQNRAAKLGWQRLDERDRVQGLVSLRGLLRLITPLLLCPLLSQNLNHTHTRKITRLLKRTMQLF